MTEQDWLKLNSYYQCNYVVKITATLKEETEEKVVVSDPGKHTVD